MILALPALLLATQPLSVEAISGSEPAHHLDTAFRQLCPRKRWGLKALVRRAAKRHGLPASLLAVLMWAESGCNPAAENPRTGALGLMQILPKGSANPRRRDRGQLLRPGRNLHLGARHLAKLVELCGSYLGALTVYHGRRKCTPDSHARRLLAQWHDITGVNRLTWQPVQVPQE